MTTTNSFSSNKNSIHAALIVILAMIGLATLPGYASQIVVPITLQVSQISTGGLCRDSSKMGAFGTEVVVYCTTGRTAGLSGASTNLPESPVQDGVFRYVTISSGAGEALGSLKSYPAAGTVTSWRVVRLAKREYLEMLIGW